MRWYDTASSRQDNGKKIMERRQWTEGNRKGTKGRAGRHRSETERVQQKK